MKNSKDKQPNIGQNTDETVTDEIVNLDTAADEIAVASIAEPVVADDVSVQQQVVEDKKSKRYKIDRLLAKQNIKFRGPFSYRSVRAIGFTLMFLAQICLVVGIIKKVAYVSPWADSMVNVFEIMSMFALPMFLMSNFCVIMSRPQHIKKYLVTYAAIGIIIYLVVVIVYFRYLYGSAYALFKDPEMAKDIADLLAIRVFGKIINYNVFIDLALFSLFYFFLFYKPKKIKSKKLLLAFRWCAVIPALCAITAAILYALHYMNYIDMPVLVMAALPCRSLTVYIVFFTMALLIKLRRTLFIKWGGTAREYEEYSGSNRSSLEISIIASIMLFVICVIDFVWLMIDWRIILYGLGYNFYMVAAIPFIMLLSYSRQPKAKYLDMLMPVIFVACTIILYLEGIRFALGHLKFM